MAWTQWRKLADRKHYYADRLDWGGPCCYELALGGPRGGIEYIVYSGEAKNERARMVAHARCKSHLGKTIRRHLQMGWTLYYRAISRRTKRKAKRTQDNLLSRFRYSWNRIGQ